MCVPLLKLQAPAKRSQDSNDSRSQPVSKRSKLSEDESGEEGVEEIVDDEPDDE